MLKQKHYKTKQKKKQNQATPSKSHLRFYLLYLVYVCMYVYVSVRVLSSVQSLSRV